MGESDSFFGYRLLSAVVSWGFLNGDALLLREALLRLKQARCLNVSAFCRAAIAEKLEKTG